MGVIRHLLDDIDSIGYAYNYERRVGKAAAYLQSRLRGFQPRVAITLGSGLDDLAHLIEQDITIPYREIPHFPRCTVDGHNGLLHTGTIAGVPIIGLEGRKHFYEVADAPMNSGILQTVFAVNTMAALGVPIYFSTNAVGGIDPELHTGDVMVVRSHINQLPNPLLGQQRRFIRFDENGKRTDPPQRVWRFPPLHDAYDDKLSALLLEAGKEFPGKVHEGPYIGVPGPTYESKAEVLAFRALGARTAGMSLTNETIAARSWNMKVISLNVVTNQTLKDGTNAASHEEVVRVLELPETRARLATIIENFFKLYAAR